jgi:hypothetical protein
MRFKYGIFFSLLLHCALSASAQKKFVYPKKIDLDSIQLITPIIDVSGNSSKISDSVNKEIKLYVISHLKEVLKKPNYVSIPALEKISRKEYVNITHNYLAWASKYYDPSLWKAPEIAITENHKYSLLIAINGYYESPIHNSVFVNFTIINNDTKKIIYTEIKKDLDNQIINKNRVLTMLDQLIDNYKI